jgi:hypothetical protein
VVYPWSSGILSLSHSKTTAAHFSQPPRWWYPRYVRSDLEISGYRRTITRLCKAEMLLLRLDITPMRYYPEALLPLRRYYPEALYSETKISRDAITPRLKYPRYVCSDQTRRSQNILYTVTWIVKTETSLYLRDIFIPRRSFFCWAGQMSET